MLCGQRVRPPWLLLLLTLVCNSSFPQKKKNEFAHSHLWSPSRPPCFTGIFWRPSYGRRTRQVSARTGLCSAYHKGQASPPARRWSWHRLPGRPGNVTAWPSMLVEGSRTLRSDPRPWGCPRAPLRRGSETSILRLHVGGLPEGCCA